MSEGYVLSSALDVNDLLNQVVSQAAVRGWTQHFLGALGTTGRRGHISKDGVVINLAANPAVTTTTGGGTDNLNTVLPSADRDSALTYTWSYFGGGSTRYNPDVLCINAGTSYDGGLPWYGQPGADRKNDGANTNVGRFQIIRSKGAIGKVHMFFYEAPAALFVVCEIRPGEFFWFGAGNLDKHYTFNGGQFYGASLWDYSLADSNAYPQGLSMLRTRVVDANAAQDRGNGWGSNLQTSPEYGLPTYTSSTPVMVPNYWTGYDSSGNGNTDSVSEVQRGYHAPSGRTWLATPHTYCARVGGGQTYLGIMPHVHYISTQNFIGGETISIGGLEYMVFPFNWRISPYDWDVTAANSASGSAVWNRNNTRGSGWALRKPAP